jgi:hypothetical protein
MWKRFHFESNRFFDGIESPLDWERLRKAFPELTVDELLDSKEATYNGTRKLEERIRRPNFGRRIEHDGEKTLRDFFVENDMIFLIEFDLDRVGPRRMIYCIEKRIIQRASKIKSNTPEELLSVYEQFATETLKDVQTRKGIFAFKIENINPTKFQATVIFNKGHEPTFMTWELKDSLVEFKLEN